MATSIDWLSASGLISHQVTYDAIGSTHYVDAVFYTTTSADNSLLCVESLVEPAGIDSCSVWYTQGQGLGGDTKRFEDLPATMVSFDLGAGPVALEATPGGDLNPTWYSVALPPPPNGVPFGGLATLEATFETLSPLEVELDVPSELMPLGYALDIATLSSPELASWTWTTPGRHRAGRDHGHLGREPGRQPLERVGPDHL